MKENLDIFSSRLFIKSDPIMESFTWNDFSVNLRDREHKNWWSRPYEYQWMQDVCSSYFSSLADKTVIDIGTGVKHPSIFILKKAGFSKVIGTEIYDVEHFRYKKYLREGTEFIKDSILHPKTTEKFDVVICISVLEHFSASDQKTAMENMIALLKPHGCVIATFDIHKGIVQTSIPPIYRDILIQNSFSFREKPLNEGDIVVKSSNSPNAARLTWKQLSIYRMFVWR